MVELIEGRDKVVRGAKIRVVCGGRPTYLSRSVQKLYPLEIKNQREGGRVGTVQEKGNCAENNKSKRSTPLRNTAVDSRWMTSLMLDL